MVDKIPPQHSAPFKDFAWLIALVGSILLIVSGIIYVAQQGWSIYAQIGGGIGLALVLSAAFLRPDVVRTFLAGRPVKYASHAVVKSLWHSFTGASISTKNDRCFRFFSK